jgi:hypothetical protein
MVCGRLRARARPDAVGPGEGGRTVKSLERAVMWVVVGLLAGWVAGYVTKDGGYGLKRDLILSPSCWR